MAFEVRDALRAKVTETLLSTFPGAQKVTGGVAFHSDVVDEETGMLFPVELKVTVKNTKDTQRSKAYDLEAEVEKAANRPGRRVADPAKKAEREAAKEAAAARKAANVAILKHWVESGNMTDGMTATEIRDAVPEFEGMDVKMVGTYLVALCTEGVIHYELNAQRKKIYSVGA